MLSSGELEATIPPSPSVERVRGFIALVEPGYASE